MPRKLVLSEEALRQIEAIGDYIARDSPEQALRWVNRLHAFVLSLPEQPLAYQVLYGPDEAGREVRQALFGVYRILYEVSNEAVYVLTVRHGARQPLGPDELK